MRRIRKNSIYDVNALADTYISAIRTICFGFVSIAQLIEVTDSAVLSCVVEYESHIFQHIYIYIFFFSAYIFFQHIYCTKIKSEYIYEGLAIVDLLIYYILTPK